MAVSRGFSFFFQDETITKVSIGEEDAKLWLLPLSFRLQEFADCLVRAHSRLLDLLDIYRWFYRAFPHDVTSHIGVPCCPILVSQNTETAVMSVSQRNSWKLNHWALLLLGPLYRKEKPFVKCRFQFAVTLYIQLAFGTAGLLHLYLPRKLKTSFFHEKME